MSSLLTNRRSRGAVAAFASSALAFGGATAMLGAQPGQASSHREAPAILADPQADNTDVYAFVSPDRPGKVNLIANWIPFEEPAGGPNFYPFADEARYNIKIDNDGDARADIIYRWNFNSTYENRNTFLYNTGPVTSLNDPDLNFKQYYWLTRVNLDNGYEDDEAPQPRARRPVQRGTGVDAQLRQAEQRGHATATTTRVWRSPVRPTTPSSWICASSTCCMALISAKPVTTRWRATTSTHWLFKFRALTSPQATRDPVVGVWSTTERPGMRVLKKDGTQKNSGEFRQVSRLGNPLVNEVVLPVGLKDAFNALRPVQDASVKRAVNRVLFPEVPRLIEAIYGIKAPKTPRRRPVQGLLDRSRGLEQAEGEVRPAEMLRLNTSIPPSDNPNRLGVLAGDNAGFPNGRRLTDDVLDIELQVLEGAVRTGKLNPALTDKVNANDKAFRSHFPYVALPHSGSDTNGGTDAKSQSSSFTETSATSSAPTRGSSTGETATAALTSPADDRAPWAPIAAGLGLAFGGLGAILMRRSRRQVAS
ncbi:MAG: DUF4331 domain-containing protein [Nocardioidaceae bacterium]